MKKYLEELLVRYPVLASDRQEMESVITEVIASLEKGGTLFVCGNGGSGSDADHIAGELLKGFLSKRELSEEEKAGFEDRFGAEGRALSEELQHGLRCISLLSHPGFTTAFGNDVNPVLIFAQQLYALGRAGDVILGISTSGNAENIRRAFMVARTVGIRTVLLTGAVPGRCVPYADVVLGVPERETFKIQELHLPFYHMLCMTLEEHFFGTEKTW